MAGRKFVHTLSIPEHIWGEFFREFFSQDTLLVDDDLTPVINNFKYEESVADENKKFDVLFEHDMTGANPNILPALVIEDLGLARSGILLDGRQTWTVSPQTSKTRTDLIRGTYILHCVARQRGESRLLASIVANAMTVFNDEILKAGLHKIDPWSIGKTVTLKVDVDAVYHDTPVQVTFSFQQRWKTIEDGRGTPTMFCLVVRDDELVRYVRTSLDIEDTSVSAYILSSMDLDDPNLSRFINASLDAQNPLTSEAYVLTEANVADPLSDERYIRASMRVA